MGGAGSDPLLSILADAVALTRALLARLEEASEEELVELLERRGELLRRAGELADREGPVGPSLRARLEELRECERDLLQRASQVKGEILEALAALRAHHHPPHEERLTEPTVLNCRV